MSDNQAAKISLPVVFEEEIDLNEEAASLTFPISTGKSIQLIGEEMAANVEDPYAYSLTGDGGLNVTPGNASFEHFAPIKSFPRTRRDQLNRVDYWLGNVINTHSGDDLLVSLMRTKTEFTALGFNLRSASPETKDSKQVTDFKNKIKRIQQKWNWQKIVEDLLLDWFTKDTMILYWKVNRRSSETDMPPEERSKEELTPGLMDIVVLNPSDCDWDNSYGRDVLKYKIPKELEATIRSALSKNGKERIAALAALIAAGIEEKYIKAVDAGQEYVGFSKTDGDNWLIVTRERNRNGISKPSMRLIFDALESRKFVMEGEFSAAYMMKHFILQATGGESITQGPLAGLRSNWIKSAQIKALYNMLVSCSKAQRVATNHTVKFNYIFPPADMWDRKKYETPEARIYNFAGVNLVVMTGQGGTNAGGYLGIKRMISTMSSARQKIGSIICEFFDNPEIRKICEVPGDVDVTGVFDENALKEPKQLLDEIKFLIQSGAGDPPTAVSELGRDPESIRDSKLASIKDNETTKVWEPVYKPQPAGSVGKRQVKQEGKGRPANPGTTENEETRTQSPRASG